MIVIAVLNGTIRDFVYKKYVGELLARQISTITLILLFAAYIWFVINKYPPATSEHAIYIGVLWLVLTLVFEFGIGYMSGKTWAQMLEDYNIIKGRIWILIPIWVAVAPYIFSGC
ncbi:hypothetical protein H8S95_16205 [Pontibacter sp. KCTC 32443]|nr:hypothetical protein [Pontibacter sp. KCTC 32443]